MNAGETLRRVTANLRNNRVYVYLNKANQVVNVALPGDLLSITNKLTPGEVETLRLRAVKAAAKGKWVAA